MASSPITSQQVDGETMETVTDFIFVGSQITADGDYSHEIKRHFLFGRKAMTNLDNILKKQRHYFADKGLSSVRSDLAVAVAVKAMVFPVVMHGCESWPIEKAEC